MHLHKSKHANEIGLKIINGYLNRPEILGIYLSGSCAKGGNDILSDVDINFVINGKGKEEFFEKLLKEIQKITNVIFSFTPPYLPHILVCYLDKGFKFDFACLDKNDPQPLLREKTRIIKDTNNLINSKIVGKHSKETLIKMADQYINLALADVIAVGREIARGDLFEARANLDEARICIAIYTNLINEHKYTSYDKFKEYLKPKTYKEMQKSLKNCATKKGIIESAKILLKILEQTKYFNKNQISLSTEKLAL